MRIPLLILAPLLSCSAWAQTVIHAGKLLDAAAGEVIEAATIVVNSDRITSVQMGYVGEPDIDLTGAFVMPGWIDMHVHISSQQSPDRFLENFTLEPADSALRAVPYAERTLMAGFTTVRDLGTDHALAQSIRRAVAEGHIVGPRIFTSGKSLATTGGVLSQASSGQNPQFTEAEIAAIVAAAEDYGYRVAAHAHGAEGMRRAVAAGVSSIEHGTYMSDEVMELMKEKGAWYVPTIMAGKFVAEKAQVDGYFSEVVRPKAAAMGP